MRILFVARKSVSSSSPNFACVNCICEELRKDGICADILLIQNGSSEPSEIVAYTFCWRKNRVLTKAIKLISNAVYTPLNDFLLAKHIKSNVEELLNKKSYDAVIAVVNPVETAEALHSLKNVFPKVIFILYEIDPASNRYKYPENCFQKWWQQKTTKWEQKIYRGFDRIIHMQGHRPHFERECYSEFQEKFSFLDIPSFTADKKFCENIQFHAPVLMLYGGAFYPKLRNPTTMFEVLSALSAQMPFEFFIYTDSRMKETVGKFAAEHAFVHCENLLPEKGFIQKIFGADVLISLGNKQSDFLPSKIFRYMATGKPIIHFYFDETDSCIAYFKKYKRTLLVNLQDTKENNVGKILAFLSQCPSMRLGKEEIISALEVNTPAYTAKKIKEFVENG